MPLTIKFNVGVRVAHWQKVLEGDVDISLSSLTQAHRAGLCDGPVVVGPFDALLGGPRQAQFVGQHGGSHRRAVVAWKEQWVATRVRFVYFFTRYQVGHDIENHIIMIKVKQGYVLN